MGKSNVFTDVCLSVCPQRGTPFFRFLLKILVPDPFLGVIPVYISSSEYFALSGSLLRLVVLNGGNGTEIFLTPGLKYPQPVQGSPLWPIQGVPPWPGQGYSPPQSTGVPLSGNDRSTPLASTRIPTQSAQGYAETGQMYLLPGKGYPQKGERMFATWQVVCLLSSGRRSVLLKNVLIRLMRGILSWKWWQNG